MSKSIFWKMMDGELPIPRVSETLGAKFVAASEELGTCEVEYDGKVEFVNPLGNIQGGFLSAMLDDLMGGALTATLNEKEFAPTLELKTNFIAPAKVGKLLGYGEVLSKGGSVCFVEGELKQHGKLVAKSTATALIRKFER